MPSRRLRASPSDDPPGNGLSPSNSETTSESFYSLSPDSHQQAANGQSQVGKPWNRVDAALQREFAKEKKAGKLSFERKVELYGEKLEELFRDLEEKLLSHEEDLLLKGRELHRLKAENYLLNCRVETISSPSKSAPRIFQTSPEHPNARIIISPPFSNASPKNRGTSSGQDIFDPQPPTKARKLSIIDDNARRSGRKRTVTEKAYDEFSTEEDSDGEQDSKRRKTARARRVSEPVPISSTGTGRRKTGKTDSTETTPKTKLEKPWRPTSSGKSQNREKEARLDRRENEELYETLQRQVTIDLLKRRGIPTVEQEEMVKDICKKLGLEGNSDMCTRAATSVRYWVAHKSWRLRDHFKILGQRYKGKHRNEDWTSSLPPISAVKPLTTQEEVEVWLFQSLGMRLALKKMMSNADIRRALWIVFIAGLRFGIRAAYDARMTSPVFQAAIESLDQFTRDFEYPVNETTGFRGKMKVIKDEDVEPEEEEDPDMSGWEFDWNNLEATLSVVQD